jgi:glycerol uptake facilitator-like aquaporin
LHQQRKQGQHHRDLHLTQRDLFKCVVVVVCGVSSVTTDTHERSAAYGFGVAAFTYATAHGGAGQLNPAVTFSLFLTGIVSFLQMIINVFFQFCGAGVGAFFVQGFIGSLDMTNLGLVSYNNTIGGISDGHAFLAESVGAFIICFVVISMAGNRLNSYGFKAGTPLAVGLAYYTCALGLGRVTGCGINPARSIAPALAANVVNAQMVVYGLAPIAGAFVAGVLGRIIFIIPNSESSHWAPDASSSSEAGPAAVKAVDGDSGDMMDMMEQRTSAVIEAVNALRAEVQGVQAKVDKVYEFQNVHGGSDMKV